MIWIYLVIAFLLGFLVCELIWQSRYFGIFQVDTKGLRPVWRMAVTESPDKVMKKSKIVLKVDRNADLTQDSQSI